VDDGGLADGAGAGGGDKITGNGAVAACIGFGAARVGSTCERMD